MSRIVIFEFDCQMFSVFGKNRISERKRSSVRTARQNRQFGILVHGKLTLLDLIFVISVFCHARSSCNQCYARHKNNRHDSEQSDVFENDFLFRTFDVLRFFILLFVLLFLRLFLFVFLFRQNTFQKVHSIKLLPQSESERSTKTAK